MSTASGLEAALTAFEDPAAKARDLLRLHRSWAHTHEVPAGARGVVARSWLRQTPEGDKISTPISDHALLARFAADRDERGRRLVVRNGSHQPREVLTSAGAVEVTVPRVNDKRTDPDTGERKRFSSAIVPPWARKTPKITEVLPLLYLHGLSSGDFVPALGQFLGSPAGLSAAVITRLTETWKAEQRAFAARDLSSVDYVYLWADGIHVNIRLEEHKLCLLVMIGSGPTAGRQGCTRRRNAYSCRPSNVPAASHTTNQGVSLF